MIEGIIKAVAETAKEAFKKIGEGIKDKIPNFTKTDFDSIQIEKQDTPPLENFDDKIPDFKNSKNNLTDSTKTIEKLSIDPASKNIQKIEYGKHYIEGTNNLKSNIEYKTNEGYKYTTDSEGRIGKVEGNLKIKQGARNLTAQRNVGGEARQTNDDGGHLIAARFGGSGNYDNLVPMDGTINKGAYKKIENSWKNALDEGKEVKVKIEPIYENESQRPASFKVSYTIDREKYSTNINNFSKNNEV